VPILGGDRVLGAIVMEDYERENAYGESDVRLLSTVAGQHGRRPRECAALRRDAAALFKESEQRAAELAIINSVQEGLAAQLDFQAIIDLVGDKIREIFKTRDMSIALYDKGTGPGRNALLPRAWGAFPGRSDSARKRVDRAHPSDERAAGHQRAPDGARRRPGFAHDR
jgi:hypothetical protein